MMIVLVAVPLASLLLWVLLRVIAIGAAYKAKVLASAIFTSRRGWESALEDVSADTYRILSILRAALDRERGQVSVSFLGWRAKNSSAELTGGLPALNLSPRLAWPDGEPGETICAKDKRLAEILEGVFTEPNPRRLRRTRAVAVIQDGRRVGEHYAAGFGPRTPLAGWSMAKSVLHALIGILVGKGRLNLQDQGLLPEWGAPGDPRGAITLDDLLRMRSGLRFSESYVNPFSDATRMLFDSSDAGAFAAAKKLAFPPGTRWAYSSGTSNILARVARRALGFGPEEFLSWPRRVLFDPLGMASAVMEPDASGNLVPSSFMLATARDWARFGLLYAQDGIWNGKRVLPAGWTASGRMPTPQSPRECYGAHWWLKLPKDFGGRTPAAARIPSDAFFAIGHEGQILAVIPSRRLVVVRLGLAIHEDAWNEASFLVELLDALP